MSEAREMAARLRAYAKDQGGWHNIDDTCDIAADLIDRQTAEIEALRAALANVRTAIVEADPEVLICTLWMPGKWPAETVVDHIDAALAPKDTTP